MKVFFVGFMLGFIIAFYFMRKNFHKKLMKDEGNAEYIFPLKPDLEPEDEEKTKEK